MKIGPLESKPVGTPATERKIQPTAAEATAEASAQVALSSTVSALASGRAEPAFDAEKVARIAQAIREGKFTVDAEAIADKLIVNAEELLARRPS